MVANGIVDRHGVGYDYIQNDASGGNMRLDVRSQIKYALLSPLIVLLAQSRRVDLPAFCFSYTPSSLNFDIFSSLFFACLLPFSGPY